jgi:hypothetical protein
MTSELHPPMVIPEGYVHPPMISLDDNEISITDADLEEEEVEGGEPKGPADKKKKRTLAPKKATEGEPAAKKKKTPPKVTPIVLKQRKDAVDKRIQLLEARLERDRELAKRYAESLEAAEAFLAAQAEIIIDERTKQQAN